LQKAKTINNLIFGIKKDIIKYMKRYKIKITKRQIGKMVSPLDRMKEGDDIGRL
jgi:hypothetical protein